MEEIKCLAQAQCSERYPTLSEREELQSEIKWVLNGMLPHGSGIDADWIISFKNKSNKIYISNSYHHMNEDGYYDGWSDFTVIINLLGNEYFKLVFNGTESQRLAKKYDIRDYLESYLSECLEDYMN